MFDFIVLVLLLNRILLVLVFTSLYLVLQPFKGFQTIGFLPLGSSTLLKVLPILGS